MQRRKISCVYHASQAITNFCRDKNCLMPLCPSCIGDHTKYHQSNHTKPVYHNICQTLLETQDLLYQSIYYLEEDKQRNHQLKKKVHSVDNFIRQRLMQTKSIVYSMIDEAFVDLESTVRVNLLNLQEELGLYSIRKLQKMQQSINLMLDELYYINEGLKAEKYLGNMIIFLKDKLQQSTSVHHKSKSQIDVTITIAQQNEHYQPKIELNGEVKNTILYNLKKIIKIDDKKQLDRKKQKQKQQKAMRQKKSQLKDENILKIQKIERSYTPTKSSQADLSHPKPQLSDLAQSTNIGSSNSPIKHSQYRQKSNANQYQLGLHADNWLKNKQTNRMRDFKYQFELLSQKVSMMRKENEIISKRLR